MGHLNLLKDDASVDKADYAVSISLIKSGNLCRIVMHIGLVEHLYLDLGAAITESETIREIRTEKYLIFIIY